MQPALQPQKIKVDAVPLANLMADMASGQLRIPRFQREFVWERIRIQKLFDSMYKEYPIGTLFFWKAPAKYNHLLRDVIDLDQPEIEDDQNYTFILDGQQRLTSLYAVIKGLTIEGEDYSKMVIDLAIKDSDKLSFVYKSPDNQRWVSVRDLLNTQFEIYNGLSEDHRRQWQSYFARLTSYPFSVVTVRDVDLEEAIEIFERINQQGKKLSRYDLIAAAILTKTFDLRDRTRMDIIDKVRTSFGELPETSITQALALNIRNRTESATQMGLKSDEVEKAWERTVESYLLAIEFVRSNLGVARADFLPYDAMLPVLAYYFYYSGQRSVKSSFHAEQLQRWFWRVAFSERYSGASQTRMTEDAAWIRELIEKDNEYDQNLNIGVDTLVDGSMTYSASAIRNGVLCLLNLKQPMDWEHGGRIEIRGDHFVSFIRPERHHIFPVAFLQRHGFGTRDVHRIPNFSFIPANLNLRISDKAPSEYMASFAGNMSHEEFRSIMDSHLIPVDDNSGIWTDNYERFLTQRSQLLVEEIRKRCGLPDEIAEEYRNPAIDRIEAALRDFIHYELSAAQGDDYWRQTIPSDVQTRVSERIARHVAKSPGVTKAQFADGLARLDFADVSDYSKIILINWNIFGGIFRSKPDVERYLQDFSDYRNAVKHNREIDRILSLRSQAAMTWLSRTLSTDLSQFGIV